MSATPSQLTPDFTINTFSSLLLMGIQATPVPVNPNRYSLMFWSGNTPYFYGPSKLVTINTGFQQSATSPPYTWLFPWHGPMVCAAWSVFPTGAVNLTLVWTEVVYQPRSTL